MIKIEMPTIDLEILKQIGTTLPGKSPIGSLYGFIDYEKIPRELPGIYMFYNEKDELLYCGKTNRLRKRIRWHFYNEKSAISRHRNEVHKIKISFNDDPFEREIYETFIIHVLKSKYNIDKVYF